MFFTQPLEPSPRSKAVIFQVISGVYYPSGLNEMQLTLPPEILMCLPHLI